MIPYDDPEQTLITVRGIPYVAVTDSVPGVFEPICAHCVFHPSKGSVRLERGCVEIPCTTTRRKDRLDVIFREVTDVLL